MRRLFIVLSIALFASHCMAQGGWNIAYVEVDSINESHVGIPVKMDFGNGGSGTACEQLGVRNGVRFFLERGVIID